MPNPMLGMRGSGDFSTNEPIENWQEYILRERPNGSVPLYAMSAMLPQESVDRTTFGWFTEELPGQAATVTGIYINSSLTAAYVYATHSGTYGAVGGVVYVKVAEAEAKYFRTYHDVVLRESAYPIGNGVGAEVLDVVLNGDSSYLVCKLIEADGSYTSPTDHNLTDVDRVTISTTTMPEASSPPDPISAKPDEYTNNTHIQRETFELSGTAMATAIRTGVPYQLDKERCLDRYSMGREMAYFFSRQREWVAANGKKKRSMTGIIPWVRANSGNVSDFRTATDTDIESIGSIEGKKWIQSGMDWLEFWVYKIFRYMAANGKSEVMAFGGDAVLRAINQLIRVNSHYSISRGELGYGIKVAVIETTAGIVYFKNHPLFNREASLRNMSLWMHPENFRGVYLEANGENRNTKFQEDMQAPGQDATLDGYMSETSCKMFFPKQWALLGGFGADNTVGT